jgi:hypothetical protein
MSGILWLSDLDIFVNFLIIIDFGVFFVLLSFLVNLSHLFQNSTVFIKYQTNLIYMLFTILLIVCLFNPGSVNSTLLFRSFVFELTFYNWYSIFNFNYFSDLQLMSDIYYLFTAYEFLLMNFYIYITIVYIYIILTLITSFNINPKYSQNYTKNNHFIFIRSQDIQKQVNQTASVRVWSKKKKLN